jgi:hypothetical protein
MAQLRDKGIELNFKDWQALEENDQVIFNQQNIKDYISLLYTYEVVRTRGQVSVIRILDNKPDRTINLNFVQPVVDSLM